MKTARIALFVGIAVVCTTACDIGRAQSTSPVTDHSFATPNGERILELRVVVPAPIDAVWEAFTTSEGFGTWAAPIARVDARVGGMMEASYDPKAGIGAPGNIRNEIVALVPRRLLVIRNVQAPPKVPFDVPTFQRLQTAMWFEPIDVASTRVTLVNAGYHEGAAYDGVYRHFLAGNRWTFEKLRERFISGPIDWAKALAPAKPNEATPK